MKEIAIEELKKIDLFSSLLEEEIEVLLKKIKYKILIFEKDEYVAFKGDKIKGIYVNLEGILVAEMLKENGEVKKIEELRNGKIIASAFIFGDFNNFPVDLIAKTDVKILFIEKDELVNILRENQNILILFLNEISNKAQFLSKNLRESISNKTINQKLAEYILKNEKEEYIIFENSIKDLSEYFNVSRPSLSRVLKSFLEEGLIEKVAKGKYKILKKDLLKIKK